jgi:hypothetical protein
LSFELALLSPLLSLLLGCGFGCGFLGPHSEAVFVQILKYVIRWVRFAIVAVDEPSGNALAAIFPGTATNWAISFEAYKS